MLLDAVELLFKHLHPKQGFLSGEIRLFEALVLVKSEIIQTKVTLVCRARLTR
jgi:hypothetical protein